MMQDNTPINFYIKYFFINCQIKKLQPIFDTFVPPCIVCLNSKFPPPVELCWQNKNISKLGILNNQSWQYNYFTNMIRKH
jgi:hypothetical protein